MAASAEEQASSFVERLDRAASFGLPLVLTEFLWGHGVWLFVLCSWGKRTARCHGRRLLPSPSISKHPSHLDSFRLRVNCRRHQTKGCHQDLNGGMESEEGEKAGTRLLNEPNIPPWVHDLASDCRWLTVAWHWWIVNANSVAHRAPEFGTHSPAARIRR